MSTELKESDYKKCIHCQKPVRKGQGLILPMRFTIEWQLYHVHKSCEKKFQDKIKKTFAELRGLQS